MTDILNGTYPPQRRQLEEQQQQGRHLAYFSNDYPVSINSVIDKPEGCTGSESNPEIMCATISSTVCAVLEEGDDPTEVRAVMISGLQYAVKSGDFPEPEALPPTQAPTAAPTQAPLPTLCVDFQCRSFLSRVKLYWYMYFLVEASLAHILAISLSSSCRCRTKSGWAGR